MGRLKMDPPYQPAGMTEGGGHARQLVSGIHLGFVPNGSLLTTGEDDEARLVWLPW